MTRHVMSRRSDLIPMVAWAEIGADKTEEAVGIVEEAIEAVTSDAPPAGDEPGMLLFSSM